MSSDETSNKGETRRAFFQDVTAGAAGVAFAGALAQLGVPIVSAAQDAKAPEAKKAESKFFKNPPPWPTGTIGNKYDHLFSTKLRENSMVPDIVPGPQAYFRGKRSSRGKNQHGLADICEAIPAGNGISSPRYR